MRTFGRWLGRVLFIIFLAIGSVWFLAPEEPVDRIISFDDSVLPKDLDTYLATEELAFPDTTPGVAKRIQWAGVKGAKTPLAVVYLHGFSATSEEIRPVPDGVARALGANLFFTRLSGHGRGPSAMAEPVAGDWIEDTAEAMAIGRRLGDRVLVISTSTGATLAAIAATDPVLSKNLAGVVMISPNFGIAGPNAWILDMPLARWWGPVIAGATRSFEPHSPEQARYWTTSYPTSALFPMAALVRAARGLDTSQAKAPALILFSPQDQVIDIARIPPVAEAWGGPVRVEPRTLQAGDDPFGHVIAGNIMSQSQTSGTIALILDWARGL